jgi:hypothetical protein
MESEYIEVERITLKEPLYLTGIPPKDNIKSCKEYQLFFCPSLTSFVVRTLAGEELIPFVHVMKYSLKVRLPTSIKAK